MGSGGCGVMKLLNNGDGGGGGTELLKDGCSGSGGGGVCWKLLMAGRWW